MCKVLCVSSSSYYQWKKNPIGKREQKTIELTEKIKESYDSSKKRYGSPRITVDLQKNGISISRKRVAKLMRISGLKSIIRRKYRIQTTDSNHTYRISRNHLNRDFYAPYAGIKWASDLTYIKTGEGWLYLTVVMDLCDRKIIGWAVSSDMQAENTTVKAFRMAVSNRSPSEGLIFHSDRGVQYACDVFRKELGNWSVTQSMSRKGNCWDNAPIESFFKSMKTEMVYHNKYITRKLAAMAIFEYIEVWYNRKRRHSYLGYLSPCEFEKSRMAKAV